MASLMRKKKLQQTASSETRERGGKCCPVSPLLPSTGQSSVLSTSSRLGTGPSTTLSTRLQPQRRQQPRAGQYWASTSLQQKTQKTKRNKMLMKILPIQERRLRWGETAKEQGEGELDANGRGAGTSTRAGKYGLEEAGDCSNSLEIVSWRALPSWRAAS